MTKKNQVSARKIKIGREFSNSTTNTGTRASHHNIEYYVEKVKEVESFTSEDAPIFDMEQNIQSEKSRQKLDQSRYSSSQLKVENERSSKKLLNDYKETNPSLFCLKERDSFQKEENKTKRSFSLEDKNPNLLLIEDAFNGKEVLSINESIEINEPPK